MTELIRILYDYAFERQMNFYLDDLAQFRDCEAMIERQYAELQKQLGEAGLQKMEDYIDDTRTKYSMELEAMFRAGLSIGQELSRV